MRLLRAHHIANLVAVVDVFLPRKTSCPLGGRPVKLHQNETVALLLFSSMVAPQKTMKGVYVWAQTFYYRRFNLPAYSSFVRKCHQALPDMLKLLDQLLVKDAGLRFMDSTMLEVCRLVRADRHRVAKGVAAFGRNWQGWHYGFKLHAACNAKGQLAAIYFTPANESDVLQLKHLVNSTTRVVVSDAGYTAQVTRRHIWRDYRCLVISPPRPKQTWLMAGWQHVLLQLRPKIEAVFGKLKTKHFLVTSFPRSVQGYALHYLRTLLGYQMGVS